MIAPNAQLVIGTKLGNTAHVGAFFGKGIQVLPFTTIKHRPSNRWPLEGNAVIPTRYKQPIPVPPGPPPQPGIAGTFVSTGSNDGYWTDLRYVPPTPGSGVTPPSFCDANDNPLPTPTEEELNQPPAPGSRCPAVAANTVDCPVDPDSLTTTCVTDSDCGSSYVCAARCVDAACLNVEHRCGQPSPSCAGLPEEGNCDEVLVCPREGAVGTVNTAKIDQQNQRTPALASSALIADSDKTQIGSTYQALTGAFCAGPAEIPKEQKDGSNKSSNDGNKEWGFYSEPITDFSINPVLTSHGIGELRSLRGELGYATGGIVFGNKVPVLSASIKGAVEDCGVTVAAEVKLFDEAVAVYSPSAADKLQLAIDDKGNMSTPGAKGQKCKDSRKMVKDSLKAVRTANLFARSVVDYYNTHGMTPELCSSIQQQVSKPIINPNTGAPFVCETQEGLNAIPAGPKINILNAWKEEYDAKARDHLDFEKDMQADKQAIHFQATIPVFDTPHAYHLKIFNQTFMVGPVPVTLAVEGYGSWNIAGGIQLGAGIDGNFKNATDLVGNTLGGRAPKLGELRAFAGPVVTPSASVGIMLFAGIGLRAISVGIEGKIALLDIGVPTGVSVAVVRVGDPDPRDLASSPWSGEPQEGFQPTAYRWISGLSWGANLNLAALHGRVDLAARIRLWLFKRTYRMKLFKWNGITRSYALIAGGVGEALRYSNDYGQQGDDIAYTKIKTFGDPVRASPRGPEFPNCNGPIPI